MVSMEDIEDAALASFKQLADKLNLEQSVVTQAWDSYQQIRPRFDLEGDQLHWLGCAVFVACRTTITPTVSQSVLEGNCVSLTSLLRYSNLSIIQFFNKIKRWAEMTKMSEDFYKKIEILQSKVGVAYNIFQAYYPVFKEIFNPLMDSDNRQHRNRRQRPPPCTTTQLFDFCWLLFITVKTEDESYSKDLVMSHHLLHACCDWIFGNAFIDERKDLLNPNFECLPREWSNPDFIAPDEAPCIIPRFYKEDVKDAIYVKKYKFNDILSGLFDRRVLQGNGENLTGILNPSLFDTNFNNLKKTYEAHLLTKGDFDERIFLAEFRRQKKLKEQASAENPEPVQPVEGSRQQPYYLTPLTGRRFLTAKRTCDSNYSVAQNKICLQNLVANRSPGPSEELCAIFNSCDNNPTESIQTIFSQLEAKYRDKRLALNDINLSEVNLRATSTLKLVYKFLENILKSEKKRYPDISFLMQKVTFFNCLYACSLEIIEYSHGSPKEFPWVLNALDLTVYDFVKVIEITIRSDEQLPRNIVKHLSRVEERILESLMWEEDTALWTAITQSGEDIPKFEDIALPGYMKYVSSPNDVNSAPNSNMDSPGPPSATETFQSPNINPTSTHVVSSQVKKNLFSTVKPGQSVLQNNKPIHLIVSDEEGNKKLVKILDPQNTEQTASAPPAQIPDVKPKKSGSLGIIFRKFYNLAGVRMDHLCSKLGKPAMDLQCKIWTVFEHSVRYTDLMKNRHLDQLLMCAVYVISKVTKQLYPFTDIMKQYRTQPQASSDIYRNVLVSKEDPTIRSDLIDFYNKVYVTKIQEFVLRFSDQATNLHLSPLPLVKPLIASPKTEIQKNIFIKPYDSPPKIFGSGRVMNYCFNRSTSEDLKDINNAINTNNGKRFLENFEADIIAKRPANRKMAALIEERRVQNRDTE